MQNAEVKLFDGWTCYYRMSSICSFYTGSSGLLSLIHGTAYYLYMYTCCHVRDWLTQDQFLSLPMMERSFELEWNCSKLLHHGKQEACGLERQVFSMIASTLCNMLFQRYSLHPRSWHLGKQSTLFIKAGLWSQGPAENIKKFLVYINEMVGNRCFGRVVLMFYPLPRILRGIKKSC